MAKSLAERVQGLFDGTVRLAEPLSPLVSVRAGGAAEIFVKPKRAESLLPLLSWCRDEGVPLSILGGGANTLVGDRGVLGVTVQLPADLFVPEVSATAGGERLITLCAGAAITRLIQLMRAQKVVGAEFLAGIPGTLGGAVAMNAGTKNGECMSVVEEIELATPDGLAWVPRSALAVQYRHTSLPPLSIVTRVRFRLRPGDVLASEEAMKKDLGYRKSTQPLSQPNFGSVFKNPPGDHAGRLIEATGLKGQRIGDAEISTKHANWIVNLGGAKARDVAGLIRLAQVRVLAELGVELEPEVKRMGEF